MNTRQYSDPLIYRAPRNLEQAFGPYERGNLHTGHEPIHSHDRIVLAFSAIALVGFLAILVLT